MSYYINVGEVKLKDGLGIYKENDFQKYLEDVGFDKYITENNTIDITKLMTTYCATDKQKLQFDIRYARAFRYKDKQLFNCFMSDMEMAKYEIYAEFPMIQYQGKPINEILLPGTSPHINKFTHTFEPWHQVQNWYEITRTAEELTIYAYSDNPYYRTYTTDDFPDGVIPLRLFAICEGAGGGGGASGGSFAGGGGGGGGVIAGVIPLGTVEELYIRPGAGGEGGYYYGAPGGRGYDSYIGSETNNGANIPLGYMIARAGAGGAGGSTASTASAVVVIFQCNGGNGGNEETEGQKPQKDGVNYTGGSYYIHTRKDQDLKFEFADNNGGEIHGVDGFIGGGGGASASYNGHGGSSSSTHGENGGPGAGGGGGALIVLGLYHNNGGNGGDGKITLYY